MTEPVEEGLETCSIRVTQYMQATGDVSYTIARRGDANLSTQVGLLELAKFSIIAEWNQEKEEEED